MPTIHHIRFDSDDYPIKVPALLHLMYQVWPPQTVQDSAEVVEEWRRRKCHHFVIFDESEPLANASLFVRNIITPNGTLAIGALGGVCVHPNHRGRGWGRDVVLAAFDFLPQLGVEVSLFQTPVPDFYARVGARLVNNRFHNGADPKDPFQDPYKMIYPTSFNWPEGGIDINGPSY